MAKQHNMQITVSKATTLVIAVVTAVLVLYSHYRSDWINKEVSVPEPPKFNIINIRPYQICDQICTPMTSWSCENCPSITMERFLVGVVIVCLVLSFISLAVGIYAGYEKRLLLKLDIRYHVLAAVLIISGTMYIVSANMIEESFPRLENLQTTNKIVAGSIGILQALACGVVAIFVVKRP